MNKRRIIMMLSILFITIITASGFYFITSEANSEGITVNSSSTTIDYVKVYEANAPYDDGDGKTYYIRYTGKASKRTEVDLDEEGYGLTIDKDGYPVILGTKITSTYKMFSNNKTITQVFVPSTIAFPSEEGENKGIAGNTFEKCSTTDRDIDIIYHTPDLIGTQSVSMNTANGSLITQTYDKTSKIKQDGVTVYVYLGNENIKRTSNYSGSSSSYSYRGQVTNVYLSNEVDYPKYMFYYYSSSYNKYLTHALLDARKEVTENSKKDLQYLFCNQTSLITLSKNFRLPEGITNLYRTFYYCSKLTELSEEFTIPDSVTNMDSTFQNCFSLKSLPKNFKISNKVTTLYQTFRDCNSLQSLSEGFTIPEEAKILYYMFYNCTSLKKLPENFQISSSVTNMESTFQNCSSLKSLPKNFKISNKVTTLYRTFCGCTSLQSLSEDLTIPSSVTNMYYTFFNCTSLETLPEVLTIPSSVTNMYYTFYNCNNLKGVIEIQCENTTLSDMGNTFYGAGTKATSEYGDYPTPIVMLYHTTCSTANSYTTNVYTTSATGNKVYKVAIDSKYWEKVYNDSNAPYKDSKGQYYIRYIGKQTEIDLGSDSEGLAQLAGGYPYVLGTKITNTYKMFNENDTVEKVFVPTNIAIKENGIKGNTFDSGDNEKAIIYHTNDLSVDKTTITTPSNVKIYVYLDNDNLPRNENTQTAYTGSAKNVYVSKTVNYPSHLFDSGKGTTLLSHIYIEEKVIQNWTSSKQQMDYMFNGQSNIENIENMNIPSNLTDMKYMFAGCKKLTKIIDNLKIPQTVTGNGLSHAFDGCENLIGWSENIKIPSSVTDLEKTFYNCKYLKTCLKIYGKRVTTMKGCLEGAGYSANGNYKNYKTPIVLMYQETTSEVVKNYDENIYDESHTGNKVTKKLVVLWTKEYDDENAPYDDGDGKKYYIHYNGEAETLELDKTDEENEIEYDASTGYPIILGKKITSTYKMFSDNDDIKMVFIPYGTAFTSDPNSDSKLGIASNTFDGCDTTDRDIDIIYHTPDLIGKKSISAITSNGSLITSDYDRTTKITQGGVTVYVYLGNENIKRSDWTARYDGNLKRDNYICLYQGKITNVYLSNEVDFPRYMFRCDGYTENTYLTHALLDTRKEVTEDSKKDLTSLFNGQTSLTLSKNFRFPDGITRLYETFSNCKKITAFSEGFTIPQTVTNMYFTFCACESLKVLPNSFQIPKGIGSLKSTFSSCFSLETIPNYLIISVSDSAEMDHLFANCYKLKGNIVMLNCPTINSYLFQMFVYTSTQAGAKALTVYVPKGSVMSSNFFYSNYGGGDYGLYADSNYISKKYLEDLPDDYDNYSLEEASQPVVVSDGDGIVQDSGSNEKIVIEDSTDYIVVTVNKKSVNEVVDETQENSQSNESVEENKSEEDEVQE